MRQVPEQIGDMNLLFFGGDDQSSGHLVIVDRNIMQGEAKLGEAVQITIEIIRRCELRSLRAGAGRADDKFSENGQGDFHHADDRRRYHGYRTSSDIWRQRVKRRALELAVADHLFL